MTAPVKEQDDDQFRRLRHELTHPPYHGFLRPQPVSAGDGCVVIRLPYRAEFRRAADSFDYHGGVLAALVDIAAHAAVAVSLGRSAPTIDLRIDYLRPAPGVDLTATAKVLRLGRSVARADVEIVGDGAALLVVGRGTFSTQQP